MRIIRQVIILACIMLSALFSKSQEYIFDLQRINPAYVGTWESIGLTGTTKLNLPSFKNSPLEFSFSFQAPLDSLNSGIGFSILNQNIGSENSLSIGLDYSYYISISDRSILRFGVKGGIRRFDNNLNDYELYPDGKKDLEFVNDYNYMTYYMGIGLYLSSPKYFLGLSVPEITFDDFNSEINRYSSQNRSYLFLTGGTIINLSSFVKLKPIISVQKSLNMPFTGYNLSTNFLLGDKVWVGGMIQSNEIVGTLAQLIINKRYRIGYSYSCSINYIKKFQLGLHELMLSYEIPTTKSHPVSVRYF